MITKRHIVNLNLYTKRGTRYVPTTLSEQGAWGCDGLMALAALRYCLGRMTYIVGDCFKPALNSKGLRHERHSVAYLGASSQP